MILGIAHQGREFSGAKVLGQHQRSSFYILVRSFSPQWRADGEERKEKSKEKRAMSMPFVEASQESFEAIGAALGELWRANLILCKA